MTHKPRSLAFALVLAFAPTCMALADDPPGTAIHFAQGASGASVKGRLQGEESRRYTLRAHAGQKVSVRLESSNASNYFNITAPGSAEALFNASVSGNSASFDTEKAGDYVILVYLMRRAARRHETSDYTLSVHVE
ncbi:MAG: DNA breaking-rejoining protein [Azospirillum brasilense]|nr:MAG: DNA breaking-rejoining protein [Azospirillum brasilense]